MWKDFYRNIFVIFQSTILRIVGFYVGRSAYIFDPKPEGNFLTLFRINNRTTKISLSRVLLTCGEDENMTLITKPLTSGKNWAFAQFKKKVEVKRARKKVWNMKGKSNVYAKLKQVKISGHLSTRLTKGGDLKLGNATQKGRTILQI